MPRGRMILRKTGSTGSPRRPMRLLRLEAKKLKYLKKNRMDRFPLMLRIKNTLRVRGSFYW